MNIFLFTKDDDLVVFCREVVVDMFGAESKLEIGLSQIPQGNDLCLWDFVPEETVLPEALDIASPRHLFLVNRQHLRALQELLGTSDLRVLLKPMMPSTLRAFLG